MELRHLRYLAAVAENGTVRKAAEVLNVAQPAISRQIHDLEKELGVRLFDREPHGMKPTPAGAALIGAARRTFDELEEVKKRVRRIADGEDGLIRVGILEAVGWGGDVPEAIARFRLNHPRIALQLVIGSSQGLVEMVGSGSVDIAFAYAPSRSSSPEIVSPIFRKDRMLLAVPRNSIYARTDKQMRLRDFSDAPFVWFPRVWAPAYYDQIIAACHAGGLVPKITQDVSGDPSMLSASTLSVVAAGIAVAFAASANVDRGLRSVKFHHVRDLDIPLDLRCLYRRNADHLIKNFADSALSSRKQA